jgi:hypothetical protein
MDPAPINDLGSIVGGSSPRRLIQCSLVTDKDKEEIFQTVTMLWIPGSKSRVVAHRNPEPPVISAP